MEMMLAPDAGPARLLVVLDPHGDLVDGLAELVPDALRHRVRQIDVAAQVDLRINLLDKRGYHDVDLQVEQIIKTLKMQFPDGWGPRMDPVFRLALRALIAANHHLDDDEQHSILDVDSYVADERYRGDVLRGIDHTHAERWKVFLAAASPSFRTEIIMPVTGKIARIRDNSRTAAIFGRPRTTLSFKRAIEEGGVLLIKVPAGVLGEGATELIASAILNLLAQAIDEQATLPPADRHKVTCIVDEAPLLARTDYQRMLAGLRAVGGALTMATQSLAQIDRVDPALSDVILTNIDALTVFSLGAEDARRLQPELGDPITVADLMGLDDYTAYARWWDGVGKGPPFSFSVLPP